MSKAKETIYLQILEDESDIGVITWCEDKINESDIEYIRIDKYKELEKRNEQIRNYIIQIYYALNYRDPIDIIELEKYIEKITGRSIDEVLQGE